MDLVHGELAPAPLKGIHDLDIDLLALIGRQVDGILAQRAMSVRQNALEE